MKRDLNFLKQNLIAHRGMHDIEKGIPENSLMAFKQAIENQYIIELDIHILKDNAIVVFHDDNIHRMTGVNKNLKDVTYEEIKELNLQNTNNKIPLLIDVLKLINGKVPIIIEFKYDVKCGRLESEAMKILKDYKGKYAIQSFNPVTVYWFKKFYPKIIRGQLASSFKGEEISWIKKLMLSRMLFNTFTEPDFVSYAIADLPNKRVEKYRRKNIVLGWTIRDKKDLEKASKYCDNYICEDILKNKPGN